MFQYYNLTIFCARRAHETSYPELLGGDWGRLVVLGCEVGGRWANEALGVLRQLARAKAPSAPLLLRLCMLSLGVALVILLTMLDVGLARAGGNPLHRAGCSA